jgi:RNA polymerase sigma-54 factor
MALTLQQLARPEQRMVLSPQMQQAIFLLQVPLQELRTIIQQEMVQNPLLEETLEQLKPESDTAEELPAESGPEELEFEAEIDRLAGMDEEWKEYFFQDHTAPGRYQAPDEETQRFLEESITRSESLTEHLLTQLNTSPATERQKEIGEVIIGDIDPNGYLGEPLEEIARQAGAEIGEAEAVLALIQSFHPPGVGARDLKECLLLQVRAHPHPDPLAAEIIRCCLEDLGAHRYPQIAHDLSTTPERVQRAAEFIATLDPKPGMIYDRDPTTFITPDLFLEKDEEEDEYRIVFNRDYNPRLRISRRYRQLLADPSTPEKTREYIREKLRGGLWLIRNIGLRRQTLRRIAEEIVKRQKDFFDRGLAHLHPLKMTEVAEAVGIHESTVSRAVANKYLQSPRGIFPLRFFFTGSTTTAGGKEIAAPHLKKILEELIGEEDPQSPLSDQEIAEQLSERGIKLARRTVAKYRNALNIPPAHRRKRWGMGNGE